MDIKQMKAESKQMEIENEFFRQQCLAEELRARYQKAVYEKMDYFLKWNAIKDEYNTLLDAQMSRLESEKAFIPSDVELPEAASELQEELDSIKEEAKIVSI
jgi:hypothetical protein